MSPNALRQVSLYKIAGVLLGTLGLVVMAGWHMKNHAIVQIVPYAASMQYNTAFCFLLCGVMLLAEDCGDRRIALFCAGLVAFIAGLTLLQYLGGWNFGIDQLIMSYHIDTKVPHPGRMAANSAVAFLLVGLAAIARNSILRGMMGAMVVILSASALEGYAFDRPTVYDWSRYSTMALHTAVAFLLLGSVLVWRFWKEWYTLTRPALLGWIALVAAGGMTVDFYAPLGIASGILYVPLIFFAFWLPSASSAYGLAVIASLLAGLGMLNREPGENLDYALINRGLTIITFWVVASLAFYKKQAELRHQESEQRLRAIVDNTLDGLITINDRGIVQSYNHACETIFGYAPDEVIGKNVRMLMPEPHHTQHDSYLHNYHQTGKAKIIGIGREVPARCKDGRILTMELGISEIWVRGERLFIGLLRDITERKRSEARLKAAMDALQISNHELEQFTYIASHDLRAPLINLRGFATELTHALDTIRPVTQRAIAELNGGGEEIKCALEQDIPEAIGFINQSVTRMDSMTNAILELSRIGRRELRPERIEVRRLVEHCLATFQHQIKCCEMQVEIGDLPDAVADALSMQQIFSNLIDNAIKYRHRGRSAILHITGERKNGAIVFSVRDNGRGIDKEDQPRIYEIFRRVGEAQGIPGEGMGMAYIKAILKRHGGDIWCESVPAEGTCFYFYLPEQNIEEREHASDQRHIG